MGILQKILEVQRRIILGENMAFFYILPLILMCAIGGGAQESYQTAYYGNEAVNQSPNNPLATAFGVRQDSFSPADGVMAAAIAGGANAVYTTLGLLTVNSRVTNNCNKINEMLNVGDLAKQTVTVGDSSTNAGLTSTQTAITAIVAKINEIIQKSTLKC